MSENIDVVYYICSEDIDDIISNNRVEIINVVYDTYKKYYSGNANNLGTFSLKFENKPNARINALPASIISDGLAGMKWVSSFPDNVKNNKQRASALITLNSLETGYPKLIIDGTRISSARTAASAVLSAKLLNNEKNSLKALFWRWCFK
ncbi:hypothetical protein P4S72_24345 [Vibrio sp. PP-XX7]